ncbi:Cytochrome p450, partial [Thalictrum thalictroides]
MGKVEWALTLSSAVLAIFWTWKVFCWIWLNPMKLEKYLRKKGIRGPSYKFLHGNLKELVSLTKEAQSRPMERSHRIVQRVLPFHDQFVESYGKMFMT